MICLGALLTGCNALVEEADTAQRSAEDSRLEPWEHEPNLDEVPQSLENRRSFDRPLDSYVPTAKEEAVIDHAERYLEVDCLRRFGFNPDNPNLPIASEWTDRRYGINVMAQAEHLGYNRPPSEVKKPEEKLAGERQPSEIEMQISTGRVKGEHNGVKVPKYGCLGEARRQLHGPGYSPDSGATKSPALALSKEAAMRAEQDSRVRRVFQFWKECMADSGYEYMDPWAANDDQRWQRSETATDEEIAVAKADLSCRRKHNVVETWYAVDVAYQAALIEKHAASLHEEKTKYELLVRSANEILGG